MNKFDLNIFKKKVSFFQSKKQRQGQALFNALSQINSDWAEEILSTKYDPFYENENIDNFYNFLHSKLNGGS